MERCVKNQIKTEHNDLQILFNIYPTKHRQKQDPDRHSEKNNGIPAFLESGSTNSGVRESDVILLGTHWSGVRKRDRG